MLFINAWKGFAALETEARIKGGGWLLVSPEIKDKLLPLLPYVKLTLEGDVIIDAEDDPEARAAQEAADAAYEPPLDVLTQTQLAIAELAEAQEAAQTANELALAELAEMLLGGES